MTFFQGSLQEGISAALQQAKSVVCFVTDGEAESQSWEDDFFAEEETRSLLQAQAVSLRLEAGSQEERYLAQLYPIPKKPTVVIIRNAELKEYIAPGVSKEEFIRRMKAAFETAQTTPSQPNQPVTVASTTAQPEPVAAPATPASQQNREGESSTSSSGDANPSDSTDARVRNLLADRAAKLAEKKQDEEEAKRQRAEKAKAKSEAEASGLKKPDDQSKHAAALRQKQREARQERERILKAIEDDKAARRARRAEEEAARKAAAASEKPASAPFAPASQIIPAPRSDSGHCALQVRLFDGSQIRARFSSNETLKDVRKWVDETRADDKGPYTFKVLLTPLPSKNIDMAEEDKSLRDLDLVPSSTLILVRARKRAPASGSSAPVPGAPQGGVFQRFIAFILSIITGFFGTVSAFLSTLLGTSGPPTTPEAATSQTTQSQAATGAARRRGGRIAGVDHTERRRDDQQFYNGNSTNFEPRSDSGE